MPNIKISTYLINVNWWALTVLSMQKLNAHSGSKCFTSTCYNSIFDIAIIGWDMINAHKWVQTTSAVLNSTLNFTWIGSWGPDIWSMGLIRYSCGSISGLHEPISTKFQLWRVFIMHYRYMVFKRLKCKKSSFVASSLQYSIALWVCVR